MKTLKEKFGQYALGQAEMQAVKGGHCPRQISEDFCHTTWSNPCGDGCVSVNMAGFNACMNTCRACGAC
jgi:hypothetical protein